MYTFVPVTGSLMSERVMPRSKNHSHTSCIVAADSLPADATVILADERVSFRTLIEGPSASYRHIRIPRLTLNPI